MRVVETCCRQVLARISLHEAEFARVLNDIVDLFSSDRRLLETRGSLIIRRLCVLLNAKSIYISIATVLRNSPDLEFASIMVQTLNLILLTAIELGELRQILRTSFQPTANPEDRDVFTALFTCWCHNPVSTLSLCLLCQGYDLGSVLVQKFAEVEITTGLLMQIDKLVQLLESPIFVQLRLQLLEVDAPFHASLLKSLYGLLMLLPQSTAFRTLKDRLATVSSLQQHLGRAASLSVTPSAKKAMDDFQGLLKHFEAVQEKHARSRQEGLSNRSLKAVSKHDLDTDRGAAHGI